MRSEAPLEHRRQTLLPPLPQVAVAPNQSGLTLMGEPGPSLEHQSRSRGGRHAQFLFRHRYDDRRTGLPHIRS